MRILVLRPREQGRATALRLAELGHDALLVPVLTIEPLGALPPTGPFEGVVLTSANALSGFRSFGAAAALPVWAVGTRLASMVAREIGREVASAADAASLAQLVLAQAAPCRLLHITGQHRKAELEATLGAAGFSIETWVTYRAAELEQLPEAVASALRERRLDAVLHYSRRSAETALGLVCRAGLEPEWAGLRHFCLSQDVAAGLSGRAAARVEVARRPDEASLLSLITATAG